MKLEVGMYVRTDNGIIGKIYEKIGDMFTYKDNNRDYITYGLLHNEITKASYNIIDILEVGDVIIDKEGHKYPINYEFETDYSGEYNSYEITIDDYITLFLKDDLSIVTHEQIEQMAYKAG